MPPGRRLKLKWEKDDPKKEASALGLPLDHWVYVRRNGFHRTFYAEVVVKVLPTGFKYERRFYATGWEMKTMRQAQENAEAIYEVAVQTIPEGVAFMRGPLKKPRTRKRKRKVAHA